ncbi:sigma-54-dependent Fis family transcriptional regulator [Anaeromyxobacter oryzae]|uniref:Sigma-54-dependent Fis family transcriptional regulator n=1 Tax=Anaeromyxobacter oryzae TaxID=2918170 RepID=A0ABM7X186_9BACT|nr:sigma-54-dependent Fis family transcriptional regulator [Anaeromyxobacter oryzae]BDG05551.1 sigma-54-dependent Fis family transcriptional regulator [Anaeromyxobacter oryzae]
MRLFGTPGTRLERRRLVDRAWQRYVQDGLEPAGMSEEISSSWRRARESYQIDPAIKRPERILPPDALAERCDGDAVFALASPILRDFAGRLGLTGHVLAYFDGDGWMLSIDGDRRVVDLVEGINFRPGANWSEEYAGTNGPGTALASGKAIEVFASEHFVAAWQPWSCAAAPVRRLNQSAPAAVIDITGPWEVQRRQAILVAKAIARAVEERLRAAVCIRDEVVKYAFRAAHESGDALVAVDARGQVIAANDAATRRRILDAGALPAAIRVALSRAARSQLPAAPVRVEPPDGPAFITSPVEYEGSRVGTIVRIPAPASAPSRASRARTRPSARYDLGRILGSSAPLRRAVELARTAARNQLPVVLSGESGTGKELFAQAIHAASDRQGGPFVAVNCGSIPAQLVEAELFGYESGTFTGARREGNAGKFEDADGGTLFLDEVSELPPQAQTALLRVLQEKEVVRLGGSTPIAVDVRIVAATNKPLEEEIAARRFRRDLHYRLNVLSIAVPPLRDRGDDVELLAQVFLAEAEGEVSRRGLSLGEDAIATLKAHRWPGNVRELRNVILRAAAVAPRPRITASDLLLDRVEPDAPAAPASRGAGAEPPADRVVVRPSAPDSPGASRGTLRATVLHSEREALLAALEACAWNYARAAQQLGVSRMTLYRRLSRCGIARRPEGA